MEPPASATDDTGSPEAAVRASPSIATPRPVAASPLGRRNRLLAIVLALVAVVIGSTAVGLVVGLHYAEMHHLVARL